MLHASNHPWRLVLFVLKVHTKLSLVSPIISFSIAIIRERCHTQWFVFFPQLPLIMQHFMHQLTHFYFKTFSNYSFRLHINKYYHIFIMTRTTMMMMRITPSALLQVAKIFFLYFSPLIIPTRNKYSFFTFSTLGRNLVNIVVITTFSFRTIRLPSGSKSTFLKETTESNPAGWVFSLPFRRRILFLFPSSRKYRKVVARQKAQVVREVENKLH